MLDETESADLIAHHPMPTILVDTRSDRIVAANEAGRALLGEAMLSAPLSHQMENDFAAAVVFFDAVAHFGSYVDRCLSLTGATGAALRLQTYGAQLKSGLVLLSFLDLDEHDRRNQQAERESHQNAGL
jgi:nitrogen-specific signal transduction histidine kinase